MSSNDASLPVSDLSTILNIVAVERLIQQWLMEDIPSFDFGAAAVGDMREEAWIICKADGILAGVPFVNAVFKELGCTIEWEYREGCLLVPPVKVAKVNGPAYRLLQGERLALNIITRASGIAKQARKAKDLAQAESWHGKVVGTRKVTPGFRLVEKYALLVGGIGQHRNDLSSMVMLKDNHIWSAGDISKAVKMAREVCGFSQKIEVECRSYDEACEAANAGAEVVMLDNFEPEAAKATAKKLKEKFSHLIIEVSGGITNDTVARYMSENIDVLSMSCLTQGYPCVDFSMKVAKEGRDPINPTVQLSPPNQ